MRLYLGENGVKSGPFPVWEVRARLDRGELSPDTLGWHDGCSGWVPLRDLPGLGWQEAGAGRPDEGGEEDDADLDDLLESALAAGVRPRPWARWWARFFDLSLWLLLAALAIRPFGYGFDKFLVEPWAQFLSMLCYLVAEACCLTLVGATPGKALLGLRVDRPAGDRLPFALTLKRAFMVYVLGNAFYLIICPFAWVIHFVALGKHGTTWWDRQLHTEVVSAPPRRFGILPFVCALVAVQICLNLLVGPEVRALMDQMWPGSVPPAP